VSFGSVPKPNAKAHKKGKGDRQSIKKIILNYDPIRVVCECVCVYVWGGRGYSMGRANDFVLIKIGTRQSWAG